MSAITIESRRIAELIDAGTAALVVRNRADAARHYALASELLCGEGLRSTNAAIKQQCERRAEELLKTATSLAEPIGTAGLAKLKFSDVAGLDHVKESLRLRVIYPRMHPDHMVKYGIRSGGGVLLFGPPGTGKTMMARAVAGELQLPFFAIKPSDILSKFVGESEQNLAELFARARQNPEGAVVFVDEIDSIGTSRDMASHEGSRRLLTQLLQELDGVRSRGRGLLFLAATNEPWLLDDALLRPGRFDEKCYVTLPDEAARRELLNLQLKDVLQDSALRFPEIVCATEGFSGADLMCLCERAKQIPFREAVMGGAERGLTNSDFDRAMTDVRRSVSEAKLQKYNDYARN